MYSLTAQAHRPIGPLPFRSESLPPHSRVTETAPCPHRPTPAPSSLGHTECFPVLQTLPSPTTMPLQRTRFLLPTHPSTLTFHLGIPSHPSWLQHPPEACVPSGRLPAGAFQWHLSCGHFTLPAHVSETPPGCPSLSTGPDPPSMWQSNT